MIYKKAERGEVKKWDEEGNVMSPEGIELDIGDLEYRMENLKSYKNVIKTILEARKNVIKGSGQAKRNAYKVRKSGDYGTLMVDLPKLTNEMVLQAYDGNGGALVYDRGVDKSVVDLLTKRYNPKASYSLLAIEVFNDLNTLSGLSPHPSSRKSKLLFTGPQDMMDRLRVVTGSIAAGNTNRQLKNEAWKIIDKLLHLNAITKAQHDAYVGKHLRSLYE